MKVTRIIILTVMCAFAHQCFLHAQTSPVATSWCDSTLTVLPGSRDTIYVCVDDVTGKNIISFQLEITFDENVIDALGATDMIAVEGGEVRHVEHAYELGRDHQGLGNELIEPGTVEQKAMGLVRCRQRLGDLRPRRLCCQRGPASLRSASPRWRREQLSD